MEITVEFDCCGKCKQPICPMRGEHLTQGYGLAGGGCGVYWACNGCDFFHKTQDPIEN